ncbi:MAG: hypothetical protein ABSD72_18765 [Terracidiphilus sp.]|jgi:hypothetical protein
MNLDTTRKAAVLAVSLALAAGMAGCRVHVDKDANGQDKKVQVDTPFGGVHVNTNQTAAADLGLPVYPGSTVVKDEGDDKSADVHLGFGEWELRVRTVSYETPDSEDKVTAFYRKAMGRYGDVITCRGDSPVGTPVATSEGLGCTDDKKGGQVKISRDENGKESIELKAGSKRHQHIMGFEGSKDKQTRFALVALDLPAVVESGSGKSD